MKKLLVAAIAASLCAPVMAAPQASRHSQQEEHVQSGGNGRVKPLEQFDATHQGGFYQGTVIRPVPQAAVAETGAGHAGAAAAGAAGTAGAATATGTAASVSGTGLGLSTPLVGSLTVGAAVGIGAAVVAAGAAIGNSGGGGHHNTAGTVAAK
ncbi:hypothetical protein HNP46_000799 [Pseudomonas nitritireducens]|uniref:Uncharacterized protein n=1 Tax=Pseudomonas nitroreducens TaxID=46680 RepID=A0A7W7KFP3_PSENT|nr:hypothetical protein [Pseudomonas nitritireducens]MBB4861962.1 hypothetical protein [Pseudomonas nitritireducens]